MLSTGKTVAVYLGLALVFAFALLSGSSTECVLRTYFIFTNSQVTQSNAGFVGLMAIQSVPIPLITGKTPNSSNYDHGNDNQDYRDDDHEYSDDDYDDDKDDQTTTMTYRSFPITDCRHAPERAHLPGLESTMCRKVRQKGTQCHFSLSDIKNLDIYTP